MRLHLVGPCLTVHLFVAISGLLWRVDMWCSLFGLAGWGWDCIGFVQWKSA